jgi:hypothetical protein
MPIGRIERVIETKEPLAKPALRAMVLHWRRQVRGHLRGAIGLRRGGGIGSGTGTSSGGIGSERQTTRHQCRVHQHLQLHVIQRRNLAAAPKREKRNADKCIGK